MRRIIFFSALVPFLFLSLSGCAPLIIGGAVGVVGGYAAGHDTIQGDINKSNELLWSAAERVARIRGTIKKVDSQKGCVEALIGTTRVWISVTKVSEETTRLKVSARKHHLPNFSLAQEIFVKVLEEAK